MSGGLCCLIVTLLAPLTRAADAAQPLPPCAWGYPLSPGRPFDFFAQHMAQALKVIARVFEEEHVTWWAVYGTLLGILRHQAIVPLVDFDVDLAIKAEDFSKAVLALRRQFVLGTNGSWLLHIPPSVSKGAHLLPTANLRHFKVTLAELRIADTCRKAYPTHIDILPPGHPWNFDFQPQGTANLQLCAAPFYSLSVPCPHNAPWRLLKHYGASWTRPDVCDFLPHGWCQVTGAYSVAQRTFRTYRVSPGLPSNDTDTLALCGIHPWLRPSTSADYCTFPQGTRRFLKGNRAGLRAGPPAHGTAGRAKCKWRAQQKGWDGSVHYGGMVTWAV